MKPAHLVAPVHGRDQGENRSGVGAGLRPARVGCSPPMTRSNPIGRKVIGPEPVHKSMWSGSGLDQVKVAQKWSFSIIKSGPDRHTKSLIRTSLNILS